MNIDNGNVWFAPIKKLFKFFEKSGKRWKKGNLTFIQGNSWRHCHRPVGAPPAPSP